MKSCENCESYRSESCEDYVGVCIRFNYGFDGKEWIPNKRICDYHRNPSEQSEKKKSYKDFAKNKHNTNFRDVEVSK